MASAYFQQMLAIIAAGAGGVVSTLELQSDAVMASSPGSYLAAGYKGFLPSTSSGGLSAFAFWAKGSDLSMVFNSGYEPGVLVVSVDGGAKGVAPNTGTTYTIFTGLPDTHHFVTIHTGAIWSPGQIYLPDGVTVLSVTGVNPSFTPPVQWLRPGGTYASALAAGGVASNEAGYLPALVPSQNFIPSIRVRGAFNKLAIYARADYVYVSKDGGAPTRYAVSGGSSTGGKGTQVAGLGGAVATYNIWPGKIDDSRFFAVGVDAALVSIGTQAQLHQFGDSITWGVSATSQGEVDTLRVAAALGRAGATFGAAGITIEGLEAVMDTFLATIQNVTSADSAVLAVGRNDVSSDSAMSPTQITKMSSILDKLVAKGYGKIIVRGVLPSGNTGSETTFTTFNASMSALVAARADADINFLSTETWLGIEKSDGTHYTDAGYADIAARCITAYPALLA